MTEIIKSMIELVGGNKACAMVGGSFTYDDKNSTIVFRFKGSRISNCMQLIYNSLDLYDIIFTKMNTRTFETKEVRKIKNVFSSDVKTVFEYTTNLYLSL